MSRESPASAAIQLDLFATEAAPAITKQSDPPAPEVPPSAHSRGASHERQLDSGGLRKAQGSYYTPADVVSGLLDIALDPLLLRRSRMGVPAVSAIRILDPACGSGNFLVEAGRRIATTLEQMGIEEPTARAIAYGQCLTGVDIDEDALLICREVLDHASGATKHPLVDSQRIIHADSLLLVPLSANQLHDTGASSRRTWDQIVEEVGCEGGGFDVVVGNPPFLSQLGNETARSREYSQDLADRFGRAAAGYTDPAALFLLMSTMIARPSGGTVCLIEPQSVLSARDAQQVRHELLRHASVHTLWVADTRVFDAAVDVCAPVLTRGAAREPVRIVRGRQFEALSSVDPPKPDAASWSSLLAAIKGFPDINVLGDGTLGDIASATADFRDQYYGLAPHMADSEDMIELPRLVTSGAIDPAELLWGMRPARFNKIRYEFPRVRVDDLDEKLTAWSMKRLVPKVLLATQTKVLEAIVDIDGSLLPSVPVITVTARSSDLWKVAALLTSPPATLVAAQRHLGAALSSDALKLSAKDVLALPVPTNYDHWARGGELFRLASVATDSAERRTYLVSSAAALCDAFEIPDSEALIAWWVDRLPGPKRGS